jgi:hypothetical protein
MLVHDTYTHLNTPMFRNTTSRQVQVQCMPEISFISVMAKGEYLDRCDYRLDDWGSIPGRGKEFVSLAFVSRRHRSPTKTLIQRVQGVPSPGVKSGRDADHHLVPRSRMSKSYTSFPPWRLHGVAGQPYFLLK